MTTATYALGRPRPAVSRGGDCRAYDVVQARNVHGPHRFATTQACRIVNGLLRLTVGASGVAPALTVEAWRSRVTVDDTYVDSYVDLYPGSTSAAAWLAVGTLTIDSPTVSALLTAVRLVSVSPEAVTIRLVSPLIADAFVSLHRGERMVRITHGDRRAVPLVTTGRRVRLTDTVAPTGTAYTGRVEEGTPATAGFPRWVGAIDPVTTNAGAFSLTSTASVTRARFGFGVGTLKLYDTPADQHSQLGDASRKQMVVA